MTDKSVPFSVLDLAPIPQGSSAKEAFTHSLDLARLAESRGYHRYWLAEHHNMVGIASAATSVLIGYLAANTTTLHLGSGGVMLPNHSPLVIAEQFGTLNTLYPGRIDLGLGRAPGSDQPTMRALRRHMSGDVDNFPRDVAELVDWFDARDPNPHVRPFPATGSAFQYGCWAQASIARNWRRSSACRLPSPRTSRRICCSRPCICIAAISNLRRGWKNRTRWCVSISSPPTATAMRSFSSPPCSRRL